MYCLLRYILQALGKCCGTFQEDGNLKPREILNQFKDVLEVLRDMEIWRRNPDVQPMEPECWSSLSIIMCLIPQTAVKMGIEGCKAPLRLLLTILPTLEKWPLIS